jgi:hypothetical protein
MTAVVVATRGTARLQRDQDTHVATVLQWSWCPQAALAKALAQDEEAFFGVAVTVREAGGVVVQLRAPTTESA